MGGMAKTALRVRARRSYDKGHRKLLAAVAQPALKDLPHQLPPVAEFINACYARCAGYGHAVAAGLATCTTWVLATNNCHSLHVT
jgi:hypothetical protein